MGKSRMPYLLDLFVLLSSGSREGSLPIPSPSGFTNMKSFALEGSPPTIFPISTNGNLVTSTSVSLTVSPPRYDVSDGRCGNFLASQHHPRVRSESSMRGDDLGVTSSDGATSGFYVSSHSNLISGTASGGHGLAPIIFSGSSVVGGETTTITTAASSCVVEGINCENGSVYAIGSLGPFFLTTTGNACTDYGVTHSVTKADASTTKERVPLSEEVDVALADDMAPTNDESGSSPSQEIVLPPMVTNAEEMALLKKKTDERFRRKSKNLPCAVAGLLLNV